MSKIQMRGICQCCGNQQAVLKTGLMSKHGYTVESGWFSGVCSGESAKPLQIDRSVLDQIVFSIRTQIPQLQEYLVALQDGSKHPATISVRKGFNKREEVRWEDADKYVRDQGQQEAIWTTTKRIKAGEQMIAHLLAMAEMFHGKDLIQVDVDANKPAPIEMNEVRKFESGAVVEIQYMEKGRVYYKGTRSNGQPFKGWVGTQAWRRMEKV